MGATIDGVVSRSVRDTAAMLDCIAGYEPGDPYTAPAPARPFAEEVGADPGRPKVGVLDHPLQPGVTGHPECTAAVAAAARLLESLGHHVEEGHPAALEDPDFLSHFITIVASATGSRGGDVGAGGRPAGRAGRHRGRQPRLPGHRRQLQRAGLRGRRRAGSTAGRGGRSRGGRPTASTCSSRRRWPCPRPRSATCPTPSSAGSA